MPAAFSGLIVVLLGTSSLASAHGSATSVPRYGSATATDTNYTYLLGCGKLHVDSPMRWAPHSGRGGGDLNVTSRGCLTSAASQANGTSTTSLLIPLTVTARGAMNVSVNLSFRASVGVAASLPKKCPAPVLNASGDGVQICEVQAGAIWEFNAFLVDRTDNKSWALHPTLPRSSLVQSGGVVWENGTGCTGFVCTYFSASSGGSSEVQTNYTQTLWVHHQLDPKHAYEVEMQFATAAYSYVYFYPQVKLAATAQAWADLSPAHGYGFSVNSVTVA